MPPTTRKLVNNALEALCKLQTRIRKDERAYWAIEPAIDALDRMLDAMIREQRGKKS